MPTIDGSDASAGYESSADRAELDEDTSANCTSLSSRRRFNFKNEFDH